jgi:hypothetical protein
MLRTCSSDVRQQVQVDNTEAINHGGSGITVIQSVSYSVFMQ